MADMLELYRAVIPESKIINDNAGQHYKIKMGKLDWLTSQFNRIANCELESVGEFTSPKISKVHEFLGISEDKTIETDVDNYFKIRCEIWRCVNRRWDPQNYATTFKAPIDLLVSNGYIPDDSWQYVDGITYLGGGPKVWERRAFRYENDGLPDEFTPDWWKQNCSESFNDILIRVIVEKC